MNDATTDNRIPLDFGRLLARAAVWGFLTLSAAWAQPAQSGHLTQRPDVQKLSPQAQRSIGALEAASAEPVHLNVNRQIGAVTHLQGQFKPRTAGVDAPTAARLFLQKYADAFHVSRTLAGLSLGQATRAGNLQRIAVTPTYRGLPIFLAGLLVDVDQGGSVVAVCGTVPTIKPLTTTSAITSAAAVATIQKQFGVPASATVKPKLGVLDSASLLGRDAAPQLVWGFHWETPEGRQNIFVNAVSGKVALATAVPASMLPASTGKQPAGATPAETGPSNPCIDQIVPEYHMNPASGVPDFLTFGPTGLWLPESAKADPREVALAFFARYPLVFGTGETPNQLRVVEVRRNTKGPHATHVVLQQTYGGLEVYGARLNVHLTASLAISSISGNYVHDPAVRLNPSMPESDASFLAIQAIAEQRYKQKHGMDPDSSQVDYQNMLTQARNDAQYKSLLVFPGQLNAKHPLGNHLAFRFQFPEADVFVSARTKSVAAVLPNFAGADRLVYDANGLPEISPLPYTLVLDNGTQVATSPSPSPLTTDIRPADAFIRGTLAFYAGLGRTSFDDHNAKVIATTNSVFSVTTNCRAAAFFDFVRREMFFCLGDVTGDILAHEFTHGVTLTTAGLTYLDESGAVNEHYSDVMGNLAFPDPAPAWLVGERSALARTRGCFLTGLRNMASPALSCTSQPATYAAYVPRAGGCTSPTGVLAIGCDSGGVHTNSGIGNLAAVRLSDGLVGSGHTGIGRPRLAAVFEDTLTNRLHPWSTYIDERNNTWESVRAFAFSGFTVPNPASPPATLGFTLAQANEVAWAYNLVGVDPRLESGWFEVGGTLFGGTGTMPFYTGMAFTGGTTVSDVEVVLTGIGPDGHAYFTGRSRVLCAPPAPAGCTPGGAVTFPGTPGSPAIFGASITAHGISTAAEPVTVTYFNPGFQRVVIAVNVFSSAPLPTRPESVIGPFTHSGGGRGYTGDDSDNAGNPVVGAPDCTIDDVQVEALDSNGHVVTHSSRGGDAVGSSNWPTWGSRIVADGRGTTSAAVTIHWWYDLGATTRYQVHYYMTSPSGGTCSTS